MSVILLLAGIGAMCWWPSARPPGPLPEVTPETDPLIGAMTTPSRRAIVKYFWVVSAPILGQILPGVIAAHYGVEAAAFSVKPG